MALPLHRSDDSRLEGVTAPAATAFLIPVPVLVLAADVRFVNLDDAAELIHVALDQSDADPMAHVPSGFERTEAHVAIKLPRSHPSFAGQRQVDDTIPVAQ